MYLTLDLCGRAANDVSIMVKRRLRNSALADITQPVVNWFLYNVTSLKAAEHTDCVK